MKIIKILVILLQLGGSQAAWSFEAQASEPQPERSIDLSAEIPKPGPLDMFINLPGDMTVWWKETFSKDNVPLLSGVLGMTLIGTMTDYETWQALKRPYHENEDFKKFADFGEIISNGNFIVGLTAGFLAAGTFSTNRRALRTAEQILESFFASGIVVQVIKRSTGRESPNSSNQRTGHWSLFPNQREYQKDYQGHDAMPSGHLSTAMSTFIVISENYPEQKWIPWVGYPVMAWASVGLVATSIHWWSDFPIALGLGYHFARIVTRNNYPHQEGLKSKFLHPDILPAETEAGEPVIAARWAW